MIRDEFTDIERAAVIDLLRQNRVRGHVADACLCPLSAWDAILSSAMAAVVSAIARYVISISHSSLLDAIVVVILAVFAMDAGGRWMIYARNRRLRRNAEREILMALLNGTSQ